MKALKLLREFDKQLAKHEKSDPPKEGDTRYRTGLGIYFIEDEIEEGDNDED